MTEDALSRRDHALEEEAAVLAPPIFTIPRID